MKLKKLESIVLEQLKNKPICRKNDFILYGCVVRQLGIDKSANLFDFLATAKQNEMPSFESVSRCRRHIQALRTDLQDMPTAVAREEITDAFKIYNISGIGE